ncbi:hypothetical protein DQG23_11185 [Paenibacillus contaminans]|uniref:Uncharacterized protein n=1 Tax=Paenibacillus contaminans TaxID=450362 RepID=A0A329MMV6_9BACL|nr:hypothetical protein DQG23_11185 [Paenibacillus contaminans]
MVYHHVRKAPHKDEHASCFFVEVLFILLEKGWLISTEPLRGGVLSRLFRLIPTGPRHGGVLSRLFRLISDRAGPRRRFKPTFQAYSTEPNRGVIRKKSASTVNDV